MAGANSKPRKSKSTAARARSTRAAPIPPEPVVGDLLDRFFGLTQSGTSIGTELRAGLATFLTMAYIMFVNPAILEKAGMDHGAVFVATCLAAAISSIVMGLYANYPIALAPGMGFNAYFAFTMVPELGGNWQFALGLVFLSGVIFFILSITPAREWLVNAIPMNLKLGIAAGIGLFLALVGFQNAGIITADPSTLMKLGDMGQAQVLLAGAGFMLIAGLATQRIPGAIIIGVLAVTVLAVLIGLQSLEGFAAPPPSLELTLFKMDLAGAFTLASMAMMLALLLVTVLDTAGTLIGVSRQAGLLDEQGRLPRLRPALLADSSATMIGAVLGTSTTTAYIESAAGVEEGGRTGLTAIVVGVLFLLSLFLAPLAKTVPLYATAPALVFVAFLMAKSLGAIEWHDPTEYIPALMIAVLMPLTYSIATGIGLGFIAYVVLKLVAGRYREIDAAVAVIAAAFLLKLAFTA